MGMSHALLHPFQTLSWILSHLFNDPLAFIYILIQSTLDWILSPAPPAPNAKLGRPRVAVIGAGITGISSAAHVVGHGFDVCIFESGSEKCLGGIWAKVNSTSGLQIHSVMYRFHPKVKFENGCPSRQQIVDQTRKLWKTYGLQDKTKFDTNVERVYQDKSGRWIVNNESNGRFDGVIACVGTCGDPKMAKIQGQENFKGQIVHSSRLDGIEAKGKKVIVVGGGASAIEALEFAQHAGAEKTYVLARSEKWIIPRNPIVDVLLSLNIFGSETIFSWIPEYLIRLFFYRDLADLAPPPGTSKGLFTETPMVNNAIMDMIRDGKAEWLRGDVKHFTEDGSGIRFNRRAQGVPKGGQGHDIVVEGDLCIMATGYERPSLSFLPEACFEEPYDPPNWYLQTFPPEVPTVCCTNCTYVNAIGTVGNYHIGIYTRFLLMFLVDPLARPRGGLMKLWVDFTRWIKARAPGGAFEFFTYAELCYWFVFVIVINPLRWKWAPFVLTGRGATLPKAIVEQEDWAREKFGVERPGVEDGNDNLDEHEQKR